LRDPPLAGDCMESARLNAGARESANPGTRKSRVGPPAPSEILLMRSFDDARPFVLHLIAAMLSTMAFSYVMAARAKR
jgi:hypothetical protein